MSKKIIIIAEAGVNHNGDIEKAFKLIDAAVEAKVDYVKFQTFRAIKLVSSTAKKADYQIKNDKSDDLSQFEMLKNLELSESDHLKLINYCKKSNIKFFSTAFDIHSLEYLHKIGLKLVKIPSGEITNLPYLRAASKLFSKVIISTGMSTIHDINSALNIFLNNGISRNNITILHCNTEYPTPMNDVNLLAMLDIGNQFHTSIGYSDHTLGIEIPIAAAALGARVIEKHFTLNRTLPGPDHSASIEPKELSLMVKSIRNIELAISGSGKKEPSKSELKNISKARKSIHLSKSIKQGDILSEDDLIMLRPGDGISPMEIDKIIGLKAVRTLSLNHKLTFKDLI